jgi:hypothetical protein
MSDLRIESNGSKWAGDSPDTVEQLLAVLDREPLNPSFEEYGNFYYFVPELGRWRVWGNFYLISHVFRIDGTPEALAPIVAAIRRNQQRPDYLAARRRSARNAERARQRNRTRRLAGMMQDTADSPDRDAW